MTVQPPRYFAIVPAAGLSARMGEPKLLLPWGQSTVIEQILSAWLNSQVTTTVVVVRPGDERLAEIVRRTRAELLVPSVPPPEMKASVLLGLQFLRDRYHPLDRDAWLLAPADSPLLSPAVINSLLRHHEGHGGQILVAQYQGRAGHPVLFPWPLAAQVESLPADQGINALLRQGPTKFLDTDDPGILADLDTPADYQRWRRGRGEGRTSC